jgi:hypothetical protein
MVKNMPHFEANEFGFQERQRMAPFLWKEDTKNKLKCVHQHYISLSLSLSLLLLAYIYKIDQQVCSPPHLRTHLYNINGIKCFSYILLNFYLHNYHQKTIYTYNILISWT